MALFFNQLLNSRLILCHSSTGVVKNPKLPSICYPERSDYVIPSEVTMSSRAKPRDPLQLFKIPRLRSG